MSALDDAAARDRPLGPADERVRAARGVAVRLGLFEALAEARSTAAELAARLGADADALEVLADALVSAGLLRKDGGRYANGDVAADPARPGESGDLRGDPPVAAGRPRGIEPRLLRAVRGFAAGTPSMPRTLSQELYRDAQVLGPRLAQAVDLSGRRRLLDVGGGLGGYAAAFCDAYPQLHATVLDLPGTVREGRRLAAQRPPAQQTASDRETEEGTGAASRLAFVAGDFLQDPLPRGFDVVLASDILHGQRAPDAARLVGALHDALDPGGLLVVREVLMDPERTGPPWAALFSLTLLAASASRCYAEDEVRAWLAEAGFVDVREAVVDSEPWDPNRVLLAAKT